MVRQPMTAKKQQLLSSITTVSPEVHFTSQPDPLSLSCSKATATNQGEDQVHQNHNYLQI